MRKTRTMVVLAAVGATMLALAGCSSSSTATSTSDAAATYSNGSGPVQWWTWDPAQAASYQKCVGPFEAANPGVKVQISQYAFNDYWMKLTASMVAGNAPDAFQDHTGYYPAMAAQGQLLPLNGLITRDKFDMSKFSIGTEAWTYKDGKTYYGLPMDWGTQAFYYNEDMIKKAGLTDKDMQNMTWNAKDGGTFGKIVAKLTVDKNGVRGDQPGFNKNEVATYGINSLGSLSGVTGQQTWASFASTTGWTLGDKTNWPTSLDYNKPGFIDTVQYLRNLGTEGFAPKENQSTLGLPTQLGSGSVAMVLDGAFLSPTYFGLKGVSVGTGASVVGANGKRADFSNSNGNSIWKGSPRIENTWKWVSYMESTECQSIAGADRTFFPSIPAAMDVTAAASLKAGVDLSQFTSLAKTGQLFQAPVMDGGQAMGNTIAPFLQSYFTFAADESVFAQADKASAQVITKAKAGS